MIKYIKIIIPLLMFLNCGKIVSIDDDIIHDNLLKSETWVSDGLKTTFKCIRYEYYNNGLLKHVSEGVETIAWEKELFYNASGALDFEIIYRGNYAIDTVKYEYNKINLLHYKITVITFTDTTIYDTTEYKYDDIGRLLEEIYKNANLNMIYKTAFEYSGDLLIKKYTYIDDSLLRTYEYEYEEGRMVKESIFLMDRLEYTHSYTYQDDLLHEMVGYWGSQPEIDSYEKYIYDNEKRLIEKRVDVPSGSSTGNHVIYYEYY